MQGENEGMESNPTARTVLAAMIAAAAIMSAGCARSFLDRIEWKARPTQDFPAVWGAAPSQTAPTQYQPPSQPIQPPASAEPAVAMHFASAVDVKGMLSEPNVKLVAVEFFATWCKPCMESVPEWAAMHQQYRKKGLRLVVVSVQSENSCPRPPEWTPDKIVCDYDGTIAGAWKAQNLPQAFLWSWQGTLLVQHGKAADVKGAVEKYFREIPRISVEAPRDDGGREIDGAAALKKLIRYELGRMSKFELVADDEEEKELARVRKESYKASKDEKLACELGKTLSANSVLKSTVGGTDGKKHLYLELLSAESACLIASARAPVEDEGFERAAMESVSSIIRALGAEPIMPK